MTAPQYHPTSRSLTRSIHLDIALAFVRERRGQLSAACGREERNPEPDMAAVSAIEAEMLELPSLAELGDLDFDGLEAEIERLRTIALAGRRR